MASSRRIPALAAFGLLARTTPVADMMKIIVTVNVAAEGGITKHIHRPLVVGFRHRVIDLVVFHELIVSFNAHGTATNLVHAVMGDTVPHPLQANRGSVGVIDAGQVMNIAVLDEMATRLECLAVSGGDDGPPAAH